MTPIVTLLIAVFAIALFIIFLPFIFYIAGAIVVFFLGTCVAGPIGGMLALLIAVVLMVRK